MVTGIDREHGETRSRHQLDVGRRLEVVGIRPPRVRPTCFDHRPGGGVHDLVGRPFGSFEFADGLLGEHDLETASPQGTEVRRTGNPETISETEGVGQTQRLRAGRLTDFSCRHGVLVVEISAAGLGTRFDRPPLAGKSLDQAWRFEIDRQESPALALAAHHQHSTVRPYDGPR